MPEQATTTINPCRPLSIWDLPASLLTQPHNFRQRNPKRGRERSHQTAILAYIYRNRFATAAQVQRRYPDFLKSDRTTRRHLAEMHESLGFLNTVPTPSPLWPKVYALSSRGMRKLTQAFRKKQPLWVPPVADKGRLGFSIHHVYHELACTEFLLQVYEATKATGIELLEIQRRSLMKNDAFRLSSRSGGRLIPDGMFLLRAKQGMVCSFLEVDTGSMSLNQVAVKLERYRAWSSSELGSRFLTNLYRRHGATTPRATFRIVWVCGTSGREAAAKRSTALNGVIRTSGGTVRNSLWITTTTNVRDSDNLLQGKLWHRIDELGNRGACREFFHAGEDNGRPPGCMTSSSG